MKIFKRKKPIEYTLDYLNKYLYVINDSRNDAKELYHNSNEKYKNCIWQMWYQGENNAPAIVLKCLESVKRNYPLNRVIIDSNNIADYISIPEYITNKLKKGIITKTHFSDYVRASLLSKYGGCWIDATCLMTKQIPDSILTQECFYFKNYSWYVLNNGAPSVKMLKNLIKFPMCQVSMHSGSSWFIVSKQGNRLMSLVKRVMDEYWRHENKLIDYALFHCIVSFLVLHDEDCKKNYEEMMSACNIYPHLLQFNLKNKFDKELYEEIINNSFIHKLTYKHLENNVNNDSFLNYVLRNEI